MVKDFWVDDFYLSRPVLQRYYRLMGYQLLKEAQTLFVGNILQFSLVIWMVVFAMFVSWQILTN
jgi:hypothetical protein